MGLWKEFLWAMWKGREDVLVICEWECSYRMYSFEDLRLSKQYPRILTQTWTFLHRTFSTSFSVLHRLMEGRNIHCISGCSVRRHSACLLPASLLDSNGLCICSCLCYFTPHRFGVFSNTRFTLNTLSPGIYHMLSFSSNVLGRDQRAENAQDGKFNSKTRQ